MTSLYECLEKGAYFGGLSFLYGTLIGNKMKYQLIGSASNMAGITLGNYVIYNSSCSKEWDDHTKLIGVIALSYLTSSACWGCYSLVDKHISLPHTLKNEALCWVINYFFTHKLIAI